MRFASHVVPLQHGVPSVPHWHDPPMHLRFAPHVVPLQHGWVCAPHAHTPPMHVRFAPHVVPLQHDRVSSPHSHVFPRVHVRFAPHGAPLVQHASPRSPHCARARLGSAMSSRPKPPRRLDVDPERLIFHHLPPRHRIPAVGRPRTRNASLTNVGAYARESRWRATQATDRYTRCALQAGARQVATALSPAHAPPLASIRARRAHTPRDAVRPPHYTPLSGQSELTQ